MDKINELKKANEIRKLFNMTCSNCKNYFCLCSTDKGKGYCHKRDDTQIDVINYSKNNSCKYWEGE